MVRYQNASKSGTKFHEKGLDCAIGYVAEVVGRRLVEF
jgi:hypothetical protein